MRRNDESDDNGISPKWDVAADLGLAPLGYSDTATVLVVDDTSMNTIAIQCLLTQFGIQAATCSNGKQAVSWVKKRFHTNGTAYKLIFIDYSMPE